MKRHSILRIGYMLSAFSVVASAQTAEPLTVSAAMAVRTGTCGENLTWTLDPNIGKLTISGEGAMEDWTHPEQAPWLKYLSYVSDVIIEEGVTSIGDYAFAFSYYYDMSNVLQFSLPDSLTKIGAYAFQYCSQLRNITLGDAVTTIGQNAFEDCAQLEYVRLPKTLTTLPPSCFAYCRELKSMEIPEGVTVIPENCFQSCTYTNFVIPDSITEIGDYAFQSCCNLELSELPASLRRLGAYAFNNCSFDKNLTLPPELEYIGEQGLPEWLSHLRDAIITPKGMLYSLKQDGDTIVIPKAVTKLPENLYLLQCAFSNVVIMPEVTDIDENAFQTVPMLKTVIGISGSAAEAFAEKAGLTFVPLDGEVTGIVRPAFGTNTLNIANISANFGTGYPTNDWHTAVMHEAQGSSQLSYAPDANWEGSCYGLAAFQILLDTDAVSPAVFGADTIADIQPTEDVISYINCLHRTARLPALTAFISDQTKDSPEQSLLRIVSLAQNVNRGEDPFLLQIRTPRNTLHQIAGYGLESGNWEWDGKTYDRRVLLWDSNYIEGGDRIQLYYQTSTLHWCIPAYNMYYEGTEDEASALLYTISNVSQYYQYFADRAASLPGDVNSDAELSAADAVLLSRLIAECDGSVPEKQTGRMNTDANGDGFLDTDDILAVLRNIISE